MNTLYRLLCITIISAFFNDTAYAGDQLRIVGSSTVYPFAASVAEHFGKAGDFRTPVVEATGTGAGFKLFCGKAGEPYITNASRAMLASEREQCAKNGVGKILEIKFGFDGITFANSTQGPLFKLSRKQIFLALARAVPKDGRIVPNPYEKWNQIDPSLPDLPIKVYGTSPVSGTYDTFIELVMKKGCAEVKEYADMITDSSERERTCQMLREDGKFVEAGENGNLIAQKLISSPGALGIFGFSFLDQNTGKIQGSVIDGKSPTFESIQDGSYPVSRPLYFYIKLVNPPVADIKQYVQEFLSEAAIGDEGYLVEEGLVPLPKSEREKIRKDIMGKLNSSPMP